MMNGPYNHPLLGQPPRHTIMMAATIVNVSTPTSTTASTSTRQNVSTTYHHYTRMPKLSFLITTFKNLFNLLFPLQASR